MYLRVIDMFKIKKNLFILFVLVWIVVVRNCENLGVLCFINKFSGWIIGLMCGKIFNRYICVEVYRCI